MIIEKDGIVYEVVKVVNPKKELQSEIDNLQNAVDEYNLIDTTGLSGVVLSIIEAENARTNELQNSLITELETLKEELKNS